MHILITYVGYNLEATWVAYKDIFKEVGYVDKVYIFCSDYKKEEDPEAQPSNVLAHEVAKRIYLAEVPEGSKELRKNRDITQKYNYYGDKVVVVFLNQKENMDYDFLHEEFIKIYSENDKPRITMNITNGNRKTTCAMTIAAFEIGASIYYVDKPDKNKPGKLEKVTDCKALDYDTLGLTEKKVLWAIKEIEEAHRTQNDKIHHAPRSNSVDCSNGKAVDVESDSDITKAKIAAHTKHNWPKGISAQSLTAPVATLEERGYIVTEEINKKSLRIKLTSTGRIALTRIASRPIGRNEEQ